MLKVLVLCMGGFSSSLLVKNIEEAGRRRGLEIKVSYRWRSWSRNIQDYSVILVAPHLANLLKYSPRLQKFFQNLRIPVGAIDGLAYSTADGEKIVDQVLDLLSETF